MSDTMKNLTRRCPRLGHDVEFFYCVEHAGTDIPCFKVFDCWWERFDVVAHLRAELGEDGFARLEAAAKRTPDKVSSLLDLIEQAKKRTGQD
ncbi:MAG: hypothetical protein ACLFOY_04005 [Desulfatibacillaceae bacterium]